MLAVCWNTSTSLWILRLSNASDSRDALFRADLLQEWRESSAQLFVNVKSSLLKHYMPEISSHCAWTLMWEEALCREILFAIRFDSAFFSRARSRTVMFYWKHALDDVIFWAGNDVETGSRVFFSPLEDRSGSVLVQRHLCITKEFDEEREMMSWRKKHTGSVLNDQTAL